MITSYIFCFLYFLCFPTAGVPVLCNMRSRMKWLTYPGGVFTMGEKRTEVLLAPPEAAVSGVLVFSLPPSALTRFGDRKFPALKYGI